MESNKEPSDRPATVNGSRHFCLRAMLLISLAGLLLLVLDLSDKVSGIDVQLDRGSSRASFTPSAPIRHLFADVAAAPQPTGHLVYLPLYSHIYGEGGQSFPLEATISIRNTDPAHAQACKSAGSLNDS